VSEEVNRNLAARK